MRRRDAAMHALLQTNVTDDILSILEPWSSAVAMAHVDEQLTPSGSYSTRISRTVRERR